MFYLVKYSVYSMPNENNSSISKLICMLIPALCAFNQNVQEKTTPQNIRDVQSLLPLVLSLRTTEKSLPSSSLLPPMRYLYTLIRSPEPFLLQGEQSWPSASPRKTDAQSPQSPLWWPFTGAIPACPCLPCAGEPTTGPSIPGGLTFAVRVHWWLAMALLYQTHQGDRQAELRAHYLLKVSKCHL